jgi:hypothetical protein
MVSSYDVRTLIAIPSHGDFETVSRMPARCLFQRAFPCPSLRASIRITARERWAYAAASNAPKNSSLVQDSPSRPVIWAYGSLLLNCPPMSSTVGISAWMWWRAMSQNKWVLPRPAPATSRRAGRFDRRASSLTAYSCSSRNSWDKRQ